MQNQKTFYALLAALLLSTGQKALAEGLSVKAVRQINPTTVELTYDNGEMLTVDFYGKNVFRLFRDPKGGIIRDPQSNPEAHILVDQPRRETGRLVVNEKNGAISVATAAIKVEFNKANGLMKVTDLRNGKTVVEQQKPVSFDKGRTTMTLDNHSDEYFYGGGVQNGRFSHRGKKIEIVNTNSWTDGGVSSPSPFYWSTRGYAAMPYTFAPGAYDFGAADPKAVTLTHDTPYLDVFFMVDSTPEGLLNDYYQLTGHPVLLPKFAFYEGHLNAYNRDYWKETTDKKQGIRFEDGKYYTESQKDNGGIKESLNGEKGNYQFSARAVVDRYVQNDMPLGWVLPNDGYGAGYGQTSTLDGNIANLKSFGDYARRHGVEIGLWTQSNLHPIDTIPALLQRDIVKEVRDAGVRVLKTDVAWVGSGYSFGLNGIADVAQIMPYYGSNARPFIITVDGWAGSQRYAGVWTGDQTGGEWEYIRFHIPTYIGSGLSGMGNITSDVDGIFGGRNKIVNVRDFQWKAFTPMQLNMDGWGTSPKYPMQMGEPATSINRSYLKLKSMLLPYSYTYSHEAVTGKPLIRAMFLEDPSDFTHGTATRYQYMYGPAFLVAPVYQNTKADKEGNDIRNGIYLPKGTWYDFFTGEAYEGGRILNDFDAPIWKLPVFVKAGSIIPLVNANNNPSQIDRSNRTFEFYPEGQSLFYLYDDDGTTEAYLHGDSATTQVNSMLSGKKLTLNVAKTQGHFNGMTREQRTTLIVNCGGKPKKVAAIINGKKIKLAEDPSAENAWSYDEAPEMNRFSTKGSEAASKNIKHTPQLTVRLAATDITQTDISVIIDGFVSSDNSNRQLKKTGALQAPVMQTADIQPYSITPRWQPVSNADYYEIEFQGQTYSTIKGTSLLFSDLTPATDYSFKVRAVNANGASEWTNMNMRTAVNPLENALHGLTATSTARDMDGFSISHLFDFATTGDIWHTDYYSKAVPFTFTIDLHSVNTLDKLQYLPRADAGNGTITRCDISVSRDGKKWTEVGEQQWARDAKTKEVVLAQHPIARYVKVEVKEAAGGFGSGREFYVFKVPGTKSLLPGDINNDGKIDENDLTSYTNYMGLKKGDADFDGYISGGDINGNGMIDAYDISNVSTRLDGGAQLEDEGNLAGKFNYVFDKQAYKAGDDITVTVKGSGMKAINAFNFILPYNPQDMKFERVDAVAAKDMTNMTYDRHHTDGSQVLYPTFTNVGNEQPISGNETLFVMHFKALRAFRVKPVSPKGMIVDKGLKEIDF